MDKDLYKRFCNTIYLLNNALVSNRDAAKKGSKPESLEALNKNFESLRSDVLTEVTLTFTGNNSNEVKTVANHFLEPIQTVIESTLNNFPNYSKREAVKVCAMMQLTNTAKLNNEQRAYWFVYSLRDLERRIIEIVSKESATLPRSETLTAESLALFCSIIDQSKIIVQGEMSKSQFCDLVLETYQLPKIGNTRKKYVINADIKESDPNFQQILKLIIPKLESITKQKVQLYLKSKTNLYG